MGHFNIWPSVGLDLTPEGYQFTSKDGFLPSLDKSSAFCGLRRIQVDFRAVHSPVALTSSSFSQKSGEILLWFVAVLSSPASCSVQMFCVCTNPVASGHTWLMGTGSVVL